MINMKYFGIIYLIAHVWYVVYGEHIEKKKITSFPKPFHFGVGTSAYQIEGAWNEDGKGESIWDRLAHEGRHIKDNSTGDIACDSYHRVKEDINMLKQLGVSCYRFSLSWTRLFPYGTTQYLNTKGVDYYNELIDGLLANDIEPMVTIFHWDTPQNLQELGGWANDDMVQWFVDYADRVFGLFGDRVKHWATMNEPANYCSFGYNLQLAPYLNSSGLGEYLCAHNILKAHGKAYRLYQRKYKMTQKGVIGIVLDSEWNEPDDPENPEDRLAAQVAIEAHFGWFAYPIFKNGDYPKSLRERVAQRSKAQGFQRSRLPKFTWLEKMEIFQSYDYLGLNHYSTFKTRFDNQGPTRPPSKVNDINVVAYVDSTWTQSNNPVMSVRPKSLERLILWVGKNLGNNVPIFITENGYNGFPNESLDDGPRIEYLNSYLEAVLSAMSLGANVHAYTWWSLMDNFEWTNGYTMKFGLYHVDFNDPERTRTPKKSAMVYNNIIKTRRIDRNFNPTRFSS